MEPLVESLQVHPRVERRDLVGVAVELQRVAPAQLADAPLRRLAPARVAHLGVDVRVETVLVRRGLVPGGLGLPGGEPDAFQRLGAIEAVCPRNAEAYRWSVFH